MSVELAALAVRSFARWLRSSYLRVVQLGCFQLEAVRALCDEKSAVWCTADSSGRWADRLYPYTS